MNVVCAIMRKMIEVGEMEVLAQGELGEKTEERQVASRTAR